MNLLNTPFFSKVEMLDMKKIEISSIWAIQRLIYGSKDNRILDKTTLKQSCSLISLYLTRELESNTFELNFLYCMSYYWLDPWIKER